MHLCVLTELLLRWHGVTALRTAIPIVAAVETSVNVQHFLLAKGRRAKVALETLSEPRIVGGCNVISK